MIARRLFILLAAWAVAAAAGCSSMSGVSVFSDDLIAQPGRTVAVQTRIERRGANKWFPPTNPPPLRVLRGNDVLAEYQPGLGSWEFTTSVALDTPGEHPIDSVYQSRASSRPYQATCHAYCWDASKVAVVVDFDRVVNRIGRVDRMMGDAPLGEPRDDAAAVLANLARDFYLCYVTELPADLKEDMRKWLRKNSLPLGPIFEWRRGNRYRMDSGNQSAVLARLREQVPTLLIGIGDGEDDLTAFTNNKMLAAMIEYGGMVRALPNVPRSGNWAEAWRFFDLPANRQVLTDPKVMLDLSYRGGEFITPGTDEVAP